jgi:hypothetical protein
VPLVNLLDSRYGVLDFHYRFKEAGSALLRLNCLDLAAGVDGEVHGIEECATVCDAEWMCDAYEALKELLQGRQQEVGVNRIETIVTDYVARANQTLEVIKLTKGTNEKLVYVYNFRGLNYYFFPSLWEMVQFFDEGKEPEHMLSSDRELDMFLRFF